jgi:hypothetical protein
MIRQAVGVGTTYQDPTALRASRLWWPGICLLLEAMLENWVRDAVLDPAAYSDITDRSTVSTARRKALTQFSLAVQDPYSCWLIMEVSAVTRTTPPAILEALLDRVGLPHDYQYTPPVMAAAIAA